MARLARSPHAERFVLKGGLLMDAWSASITRPTVDIDLLGYVINQPATIESIIRDVCSTQVEPDGLVFSAEKGRAERITEDAEYHGVRMRFEARLGSARVPMQVDVGFGDVVIPGVDTVSLRPVLDYVSGPVRAYTRESSIAEKLHAMVKLGAINSRMNDFFDLWYLSTTFDFDGETLGAAIAATFAARGTVTVSTVTALSDGFANSVEKQAQWSSFLRKSRLDGAPASFGEVVGRIAGFVTPVLEVLQEGRSYHLRWRYPGPWV
ncbi:MAG: nucleotidyl transferase AbiEii/AbiGii toxin family protein [Gaiellales bacterium]|nr:nucleotidyl transferase AbiEii/AbiGii toxin family protein [Gaiellales bacterium]